MKQLPKAGNKQAAPRALLDVIGNWKRPVYAHTEMLRYQGSALQAAKAKRDYLKTATLFVKRAQALMTHPNSETVFHLFRQYENTHDYQDEKKAKEAFSHVLEGLGLNDTEAFTDWKDLVRFMGAVSDNPEGHEARMYERMHTHAESLLNDTMAQLSDAKSRQHIRAYDRSTTSKKGQAAGSALRGAIDTFLEGMPSGVLRIARSSVIAMVTADQVLSQSGETLNAAVVKDLIKTMKLPIVVAGEPLESKSSLYQLGDSSSSQAFKTEIKLAAGHYYTRSWMGTPGGGSCSLHALGEVLAAMKVTPLDGFIEHLKERCEEGDLSRSEQESLSTMIDRLKVAQEAGHATLLDAHIDMVKVAYAAEPADPYEEAQRDVIQLLDVINELLSPEAPKKASSTRPDVLVQAKNKAQSNATKNRHLLTDVGSPEDNDAVDYPMN